MNNSKLGRPYVTGAPRKEIIRFYLSIDELRYFERLEQNVIYYYSRLGYKYNRSVHLRQLLKYFDDVNILNLVTEDLPLNELKKIGVVIPPLIN